MRQWHVEYEEVEQNGIRAKGKKEYLKYLNGEYITRREALLAKCYECMGCYVDGKEDCGVNDCPLYPYFPYRPAKSIPVAKKKRHKGKDLH